MSRDGELTEHQNDFIAFYQLHTEICETTALKPFVEQSSDGIAVALVTGNDELFAQALSKQQDMAKTKAKTIENLKFMPRHTAL